MNSVLITGCNRGLGLGLVKSLLNLPKPPKYVFATCRNAGQAKELKELAEKNDCVHILEIDLKNFNQYDRLVNDISGIIKEDGLNVLINNAGVSPKSTRLHLVTSESMTDTLITNTVVPVMLAKACVPLLTKASLSNCSAPMGVKRAAIINMSSILGSIHDNNSGGIYAYRTSKCGLNAATKSMSIDLKNANILCVSVHPGWVRTDMGGSKAPLDIETSCNAMVNTFLELNESHNGGFIQYDGKALPW